MGKKFARTVYLRHPETYERNVFVAGDDVPSWVEDLEGLSPAIFEGGPKKVESPTGENAPRPGRRTGTMDKREPTKSEPAKAERQADTKAAEPAGAGGEKKATGEKKARGARKARKSKKSS